MFVCFCVCHMLQGSTYNDLSIDLLVHVLLTSQSGFFESAIFNQVAEK